MAEAETWEGGLSQGFAKQSAACPQGRSGPGGRRNRLRHPAQETEAPEILVCQLRSSQHGQLARALSEQQQQQKLCSTSAPMPTICPLLQKSRRLQQPQSHRPDEDDIFEILGINGVKNTKNGIISTSDFNGTACQYLHCRCGWTPTIRHRAGKVDYAAMRYSAEQHWRGCQGTKPPKLNSFGEKARSAFNKAVLRISNVAGRKTALAAANHSRRIQKLPPKVREATCALDLTKPSIRKFKSGQSLTVYPCKRCGISSSPAWVFKGYKCRQSSSSIKIAAYRKAILGVDKYKKKMEKKLANAKKRWAANSSTPAGLAYRAKRNEAAKAKRRAAKAAAEAKRAQRLQKARERRRLKRLVESL